MPKKKSENTLTQTEQSKRFLAKAAELEAAGELNPTEAAKAVERLVGGLAPKKPNTKRGKTA